MKKLFLSLFLFISFYSSSHANFICENQECNDKKFKNLNILYTREYYFIAKINKNLEIQSIASLFGNNFFILLEKNNLFFLKEILNFLEKRPSDFVVLRVEKEGQVINYALKIQCHNDSFSIISDNQEIAYKNEIFDFKTCENIEKIFLFQKIKIFVTLIFIF